ncbi:MAG: LysE family translocator [Bacteroidetes bacterium]|nr:MAG: LysE family translocator [Bacteroidota bacterium]
MAFLEGYLTGLGLALILSFGPVFFTLLHGSLEYGFRSGLAVALGIFLGDATCLILLMAFGVSDIVTDPEYQVYLGVGGAVVLIFLGVRYLTKPYLGDEEDKAPHLKRGHYFSFALKGFLVNFINPFVFVVWLGIMGLAGARYLPGQGMSLFLIGTLAAILSTDVLKALFAHRIKPLLKPHWITLTFRGIGIALILFGVRILYAVFFTGFTGVDPHWSLVQHLP